MAAPVSFSRWIQFMASMGMGRSLSPRVNATRGACRRPNLQRSARMFRVAVAEWLMLPFLFRLGYLSIPPVLCARAPFATKHLKCPSEVVPNLLLVGVDEEVAFVGLESNAIAAQTKNA